LTGCAVSEATPAARSASNHWEPRTVLSSSVTHASTRQVLRQQIEALDDVTRVLFDDEEEGLWVVCRTGAEPERITETARTTLDSLGLDPDRIHVRIAIEAGGERGRRVRLAAVERVPESETVVRVRVTLEWEGRPTTAEVAGEPGSQVELRTAALATVEALELITGQALGLRLSGVKALRVFDEELMTVAFYRAGPPPARYVGTATVGSDPLHAAAAAVLNGLNRLLGLFLRGVAD
jgi:hypothetical protein